MIWKPRGQIR